MKALVLTGLALGLTIMGAGGWAAWNSTAIAHRDAGGGGLQIEVVAPKEPNLPASPIMTVGELQGGYVHDPDRLQRPVALNAYIETAWAEPEPLTEPPPERPDERAWVTSQAAKPVQLEPHDYSFGFDQPLPEQTDAYAGHAVDDSPPWDERGLD